MLLLLIFLIIFFIVVQMRSDVAFIIMFCLHCSANVVSSGQIGALWISSKKAYSSRSGSHGGTPSVTKSTKETDEKSTPASAELNSSKSPRA